LNIILIYEAVKTAEMMICKSCRQFFAQAGESQFEREIITTGISFVSGGDLKCLQTPINPSTAYLPGRIPGVVKWVFQQFVSVCF